VIRCPKCGHEWKDEGRAKGGRASRRTITPEQQARMQAARNKNDKLAERAGIAGGWSMVESAMIVSLAAILGISVWVLALFL
jgi:hypothetical protein